MERFTPLSKLEPTKHAIDRLRERFYPDLSDEKAGELLRKLAQSAKPLKVRGGRN